MAENFSNLGKEIDIHLEVQRIQNKMYSKRPTSRLIIKMSKLKEKEIILKTTTTKKHNLLCTRDHP